MTSHSLKFIKIRNRCVKVNRVYLCVAFKSQKCTNSRVHEEQVHYYAKDIRCATRYYRFDRYYLYVIHVFDDHELLLHKHNFKK